MAASGSLRMALGHRAMAKKYNDTQAPIVQPEPVSPEVNSSTSWEEERGVRDTHGAWQVFMCVCVRPPAEPSGKQENAHVVVDSSRRSRVGRACVGCVGPDDKKRQGTSVPL